jgi:hypothetical protein
MNNVWKTVVIAVLLALCCAGVLMYTLIKEANMSAVISPTGPAPNVKYEEPTYADPNEILGSPFGKEVNIPLSPAARKALEDSIAEEMKVRVPLFCVRTKNGQIQVLCGTNRLEIAQKLKLETVPVIIVAFETMEVARQFAIKDNAQRRQLSQNDMVHQAYLLWKSYEAEKSKVKGITPRRRAADACGIGDGTLGNFSFVMDSDFPGIIDDMLSNKLSVNAAFNKAKALTDAADASDTPSSAPAPKVDKVEADLKAVASAIKVFCALAERIETLAKSVGGCGAAEKKQLLRKFKKYQDAFQIARGEDGINKILDALETLEIALL